MKKNLRVIQINGFRGLVLAFFTVSCLIAGFIAFPAFLMMNAWNYLAETTSSFPTITFLGGVLLWAIIAFSIFIFNKKKFIVSFNAQQELTDEEVREVVKKITSQTMGDLPRTKDFHSHNFNQNSNDAEVEKSKELSVENKDN